MTDDVEEKLTIDHVERVEVTEQSNEIVDGFIGNIIVDVFNKFDGEILDEEGSNLESNISVKQCSEKSVFSEKTLSKQWNWREKTFLVQLIQTRIHRCARMISIKVFDFDEYRR